MKIFLAIILITISIVKRSEGQNVYCIMVHNVIDTTVRGKITYNGVTKTQDYGPIHAGKGEYVCVFGIYNLEITKVTATTENGKMSCLPIIGNYENPRNIYISYFRNSTGCRVTIG